VVCIVVHIVAQCIHGGLQNNVGTTSTSRNTRKFYDGFEAEVSKMTLVLRRWWLWVEGELLRAHFHSRKSDYNGKEMIPSDQHADNYLEVYTRRNHTSTFTTQSES
jgi:hypothetical protein